MKKRLLSFILIIACFVVALFPAFQSKVSASADTILFDNARGISVEFDDRQGRAYPFGLSSNLFNSVPIGQKVFFHIDEYYCPRSDGFRGFACYPTPLDYSRWTPLYSFPSVHGFDFSGSFIVPFEIGYFYIYLGAQPTVNEPMQYFKGLKMWYYTPLGTVLDYSDNMITTVVNNQSIFNVFFSPQDGITPLGFILISLLAVVLFLLVLYIVKKIIFRGE